MPDGHAHHGPVACAARRKTRIVPRCPLAIVGRSRGMTLLRSRRANGGALAQDQRPTISPSARPRSASGWSNASGRGTLSPFAIQRPSRKPTSRWRTSESPERYNATSPMSYSVRGTLRIVTDTPGQISGCMLAPEQRSRSSPLWSRAASASSVTRRGGGVFLTLVWRSRRQCPPRTAARVSGTLQNPQ